MCEGAKADELAKSSSTSITAVAVLCGRRMFAAQFRLCAWCVFGGGGERMEVGVWV